MHHPVASRELPFRYMRLFVCLQKGEGLNRYMDAICFSLPLSSSYASIMVVTHTQCTTPSPSPIPSHGFLVSDFLRLIVSVCIFFLCLVPGTHLHLQLQLHLFQSALNSHPPPLSDTSCSQVPSFFCRLFPSPPFPLSDDC